MASVNYSVSALQRVAIEIVRSCLSTITSFSELRNMPANNWYSQVQPVIAGTVGRPSFEIPPQQLCYLIENGFSVPQIADMIGVSVRTVRRRMSDFVLSIRAQYSLLTNAELDAIVADIQSQFPMCGNRQMQGHLHSRGYRVQQTRISKEEMI